MLPSLAKDQAGIALADIEKDDRRGNHAVSARSPHTRATAAATASTGRKPTRTSSNHRGDDHGHSDETQLGKAGRQVGQVEDQTRPRASGGGNQRLEPGQRAEATEQGDQRHQRSCDQVGRAATREAPTRKRSRSSGVTAAWAARVGPNEPRSQPRQRARAAGHRRS